VDVAAAGAAVVPVPDSVPEPGTVAVLAIAGTALLVRRRRRRD
jgi:hypothetical protein